VLPVRAAGVTSALAFQRIRLNGGTDDLFDYYEEGDYHAARAARAAGISRKTAERLLEA
jgi:hypothetical protein